MNYAEGKSKLKFSKIQYIVRQLLTCKYLMLASHCCDLSWGELWSFRGRMLLAGGRFTLA